MYDTVYTNLCEDGKDRRSIYRRGSGLHAHHIIPKHNGGTNDQDNITYLTVREHVIAHYILWKLYRQPNDLRAMHMLGANLTTHQRRIVGEYCRDHSLGFHGASPEQRDLWRSRGQNTQSTQRGSYIWWSSPEGRSERSRLGGKSTWSKRSSPKFIAQMSSFKDTDHARKSGITAGKKPVTDGASTRKFHTNEEVESFLVENTGWRRGVHWSSNRGVQTGPSKKRIPVTDGATKFSYVGEAAIAYGVSDGTIRNWCKSDKKINWRLL